MEVKIKIRENLKFRVDVLPGGVVSIVCDGEGFIPFAISNILEDNPNLEPRSLCCTASKHDNTEHFYMAILILVEK